MFTLLINTAGKEIYNIFNSFLFPDLVIQTGQRFPIIDFPAHSGRTSVFFSSPRFLSRRYILANARRYTCFRFDILFLLQSIIILCCVSQANERGHSCPGCERLIHSICGRGDQGRIRCFCMVPEVWVWYPFKRSWGRLERNLMGVVMNVIWVWIIL